jgi:hypothetical protein
MPTRLVRRSVSVWLPAPVHAALRAISEMEGASLPALARRAAAAAMKTAAGRVRMDAPTVEAVVGLGTAGDGLHQLLPTANAAANTAAQTRIGHQITAGCNRIAAAAGDIRLNPPTHDTVNNHHHEPAPEWKLVRVTTDAMTVQMWKAAAGEAGFKSVANWVRDALAGAHGLDLPRPPAPATIEARVVTGRILGFIAQAETMVSDWPACGVLDEPITQAADALYTALHCLVAHGGDPRARR